MSYKMRKGLWPVALAVVAIGALALLVGFAGGSGTAQAHGKGAGHAADECATFDAARIHDVFSSPDCLAAPTGVGGTPTADSIMLTWDAVTGADSYIVERKTGSGAYGNSMDSAGNSATVSSLMADTAYTFRVRATSAAAGEGRWSDDTVSGATIMTLAGGNGSNVGRGSATKPSAPALMSISRATDNQDRPVLPSDGKLMIKWAHPNDGGTPITGYDVRYTMTPADADSWHSANDLPAGKASRVITGLANGETYYVQVRAKNRLGNSPWSARRSGDPVAVPSAPMSLSVAGDESRVVVSWEAPASGGDHPIDQYNWDVDDTAAGGRDSYGTFGSRRYRMMEPQMFFPGRGGAITTSAASGGEGCLEVTVSASNATADDPDGSTRSLPGDEAMVTCAGAPSLTKQMVDNVAILRWNEPSLGGGTEVTEYVVRRWGFERLSPTDPERIGAHRSREYREWHLGGSERSMWDTGLSHQTLYSYAIYAITDRYNLGYDSDRYNVSRPVTAFTSTDGGLILAPPSPPSAPRSLEAMDQCADQISLSWMAPSNFGGGVDVDRNREWSHGKIVVSEAATIESYDVEYRVRGAGSWMDLTATDMGAVVTSGLEYGKTYDFRVRAMNDIGLYGPWAMTSKTLDEPPTPLRPTALRVNLETDQEGNPAFELQWDAPNDTATPKLWRTMADFEQAKDDADYLSDKLTYVVEWQIGNGDWNLIVKQPHEYSRSGLATTRTQEFIHSAETDDDFSVSAIRGKAVKYRVAAEVDECNRSNWNQADEVEVPAATVPEMPTGLTATPKGQNQIDLAWTAPADGGSPITGYTFEYSTDGGTAWSDPAATDSMTSHSHTGLTANTTYHYRVTAVNAVGSSMASATRMAKTAAAPELGTITDLALSNALQLTWTTPAGAAAQIAIVVNAADDTDFCLAPLGGDASSYTCSRSDTTGKTYVGLVIAQDGRGGSTISNFPIRTVQ